MNTLDCSGCGATLDVSAMKPGTAFACGACNAALTVPAAAARPARPARRAGAKPAAKPASKLPLFAGIGGGVLVLGGIAFFATRKPPAPPPAPPPVALRPETGSKAPPPPPAPPPEKPLSPEEAEWKAATTENARGAWVEHRLDSIKGSDDAARAAYDFLKAKVRPDLARRAAEARLQGDPGNAWANGVLDRKDYGAELSALAAKKELKDNPIPEGDRLLKRLEEKRTWVAPGDDRRSVDADLEAVAKHLKTLSDPWNRQMLDVLKAVRADSAYAGVQKNAPLEYLAWPPYLVIAEKQPDPMRLTTKNVLERHSKFFQCLTKEFLRIMGEAGMPTPTLAEMGNPVLKAFVFKDRNSFDRWHMDQQWPKDALKGIRAYYAWGGTQFMMMYDTGASSYTQDDDTCTAFHEATHQLVHYYRRYYMTLEDRKKDPAAPEVGLLDRRLNGATHWFQEGFAEFFGAADRISAATGEWKLFRPLKNRLNEWGDPKLRQAPQWTLEEVIGMKDRRQLTALSEKKMPGQKEQMESLFYAQAWALNHYLYFGKDEEYRPGYLKYVHEEMLCRGDFETFYRCMGVGADKTERAEFLERLTAEWRGYQGRLLRKANGE